MRTVTDRGGVEWDVFEVSPRREGRTASRVPDQYRAGWLCFQSLSERRRLAPIPRCWAEWEDHQLLSALRMAEGFLRRTPQSSITTNPERRAGF